MQQRHGARFVAVVTGALLALAGCSTKERVLTALDVAPRTPHVAKGLSQRLLATAIYDDGSSEDVTDRASWSTSNGAVVRFSETPGAVGIALTVAEGEAEVSARFGNATGATVVRVGPAELAAIEVSPLTPTLPALVSQAFTAVGIYTDGSKQDVTEQAAWASSDPSIVEVSNQPATKGLATAKTPGTATVRATLGTRSAGTLVTVNPLQLVSLDLGQTSVELPNGSTQQLVLTGLFTDGSHQDVSASAVWSSSDPGVVTVSDLAGNKGLLSALKEGSATVGARFAGQTAEVRVTVTPAKLLTIDVRPKSSTLTAGTSQQFTATGIYSDNTKLVITDQVAWSIGDEKVALISTAAGSKGLVSAKTAGTTKVIAELGGLRASTGLTVIASQLTSIELSVKSLSLPVGASQQVRALGTYSDGAVQDVTESVVWASSDPQVAGVSNAQGSSGLVRAQAAGACTLSASLNGVQTSAPVIVTEATLASIEIGAPATSLARGTSLQLTATGVYSDDSRRDLTAQATWLSTAQDVAIVSNSPGSVGLVTARAAGTTLVGAAFGGRFGSVQLAVTDARLVGLTLTPSEVEVVSGLSVQLRAEGLFGDGSTQDVTARVVWSSSDEALAEVSNDPASSGLVTGVDEGQVTITAQLEGQQSSATVTITPAQLVGLTLTPKDPVIAVGESLSFSADGRYTDGSLRPVTTAVTWSSSDAQVATVSDEPLTRGVAQGVSAGQCTIRVELEGKVQATRLTVGAP